MQVLENLIHRFRRFAETHTQVQTFSHGQVTDFDLDKLPTYPVMHVVWNGIDTPTDLNELVYQFQILFADKPTIAEDKPEQALYAMNDCVNYALDLLAVIKQGEEGDIFNDDFSIASASIQAVQEAYSHVLWGCVLNIGISVHHPYNLCDAPIGTISGDFEPCTLCNVIAGKTALQILECLTAEQEVALSAELCESAGVATYTNGAAFTQEIEPGETYTAPQVQMTAVDGTTENIPANTNYVCEWVVLSGVDSEGNQVMRVSEFPTGGEFLIPDTQIHDASGVFGTLPYRLQTLISNANLASAVNVGDFHQLTIEVDVPVNNSNGDSVGSNVDDLLNPHVLPDVALTDSDGAVGSYPMPTTIDIQGQVNSASYSGGTLTINPAGGGSNDPIYQRSTFRGVPDTQYDLYDLKWQIDNGTYNYGTPNGKRVALDFTAAHPFFTLVDNNAFGNKSRFTDSNGLAAPDGLAGFAAIDWAVDRPTAIANYAIDHLTGLGWCLVKIGINQTHTDALASAHAHTMGALSGFRMPSTGEIEDVLNTAITTQFYGTGNIFYRASVYVSGLETAMFLNSTNIGNTAQANALNNSGDISRANKTGASTTATYAVRTHYP